MKKPPADSTSAANARKAASGFRALFLFQRGKGAPAGKNRSSRVVLSLIIKAISGAKLSHSETGAADMALPLKDSFSVICILDKEKN